MKSFATFITALIIAGWVAVIALISVQNAAPITLRFLNFQTIEMPFGLVLAFCAVLGILGTAIAQPLLGFSGGSSDEEDF